MKTEVEGAIVTRVPPSSTLRSYHTSRAWNEM